MDVLQKIRDVLNTGEGFVDYSLLDGVKTKTIITPYGKFTVGVYNKELVKLILSDGWQRADEELPELNKPVMAICRDMEGIQDMVRTDEADGDCWLWARNASGWGGFNFDAGEYLIDDGYFVEWWRYPPELPK